MPKPESESAPDIKDNPPEAQQQINPAAIENNSLNRQEVRRQAERAILRKGIADMGRLEEEINEKTDRIIKEAQGENPKPEETPDAGSGATEKDLEKAQRDLEEVYGQDSSINVGAEPAERISEATTADQPVPVPEREKSKLAENKKESEPETEERKENKETAETDGDKLLEISNIVGELDEKLVAARDIEARQPVWKKINYAYREAEEPYKNITDDSLAEKSSFLAEQSA